MPELPEVETVARQLAPQLIGRTVQRMRILDARLRPGPVPRVAGRQVLDVRRSGKRVLLELTPARGGRTPLWLAVHLRMTGRLLWRDDRTTRTDERVRARFELDRGQLLFVDTRRFGTFDWYRTAEAAAPEGVEPLSPELDGARLARLIGGSKQPVKTWLLRQDRLVGLGNIYASEILHAARIAPQRAVAGLSAVERRRMLLHTRRILERAIGNCGTTFSDFQDARGVEGSYQQFLAVYGREGGNCRRCRGTILRCVQQQRSTFYCADCQH